MFDYLFLLDVILHKGQSARCGYYTSVEVSGTWFITNSNNICKQQRLFTGSKNNANKEKWSLKDKKESLYSPASTNCQNSFKSVNVANLGIMLKKSLLK